MSSVASDRKPSSRRSQRWLFALLMSLLVVGTTVAAWYLIRRGNHETVAKSPTPSNVSAELPQENKPEIKESPFETARKLVESAKQLCTRHQAKDAVPILQQALTLCDALKDQPDATELQHFQGDLCVRLAQVQIKLKNPAEAEPFANRAVDIAEKMIANTADNPRTPMLLASAVCQWGDCQLDREPQTALKRYERAITTVEPIHTKNPSESSLADSLRYALEQRAQAKLRLKRLAEARADWDKAMALESPSNRMAQLGRWGMALAHGGYVTEAIIVTEKLADGPDANWESTISAARIHSVLASATDDSDANHSGRALELLTLAVSRGLVDVQLLSSDEELSPLRERFDFRRLIAELEAKKAKPPKTGG